MSSKRFPELPKSMALSLVAPCFVGITASILAIAMLFSSCSQITSKEATDGGTETEETKDEVLTPEGTGVKGDTRFQYLTDETALSDCYIVGHFIDNDIEFITVDFITYKLNKESEKSISKNI